MTLEVQVRATVTGRLHLGAERGDRREVRERMLERGGRDRRPPALPVGLRRHRLRHADRVDGLRVLGRRPGRVARGRGAAARADQCARAVRAPLVVSARSPRSPSSCCPAPGRGALVRRPRAVDLPPGARIEVRRADHPVRLARLSHGGVHRPARREVRLPGPGLARAPPARDRSDQDGTGVIEEIRIRDLGVIDEAVLVAASGAHRAHRRDRRGQDDGRHRARPAARRPGDSGARAGRRRPRRRRGRRRPAAPATRRCRRAAEAGADVGDGLVLVRSVVGRRSLPGPRRRPRRPGGRARRARRAPRRRARPGRPVAAAPRRPAPRGARRVRRTRRRRRALHLPRGARRAHRRGGRAGPPAHGGRGAGPRGRCPAGRARARSRPSTPSPARTPRSASRASGSGTPKSCAPGPGRRTPRSPVTTTLGCRRRACSRRSPPRRPASRR